MAVLPLIEKKLSQRPLDSKKAIYALCGGLCVLLVFVGSAILILEHAEASHDIVSLASLTIMFFGAVVTTLITGQAAMDWKAMSAIQSVSESVESNQPVVRNYKPKYYDSEV